MTTLPLWACTTHDPYRDLVEGTIAYPFIEKPTSMGHNGTEEKFVIRTTNGATEYTVEIPHAAAFYDVEVPIADLKGSTAGSAGGAGEGQVKNPQITDRELVANLPKLSVASREEQALIDQAFGVGEPGGPRQSPSYVLGISKINDLYKQRKYEYALVEINNMLAFYPTSSQLYKMKGTILIKTSNFKLAEKAWIRAQELSPADPVLRKGLDRLRRRISANQQEAARAAAEDKAIQDAIAH